MLSGRVQRHRLGRTSANQEVHQRRVHDDWTAPREDLELHATEHIALVGVTKAATAALGFRSLLAHLGVNWPAKIWTDSTVSIGMCSRQGLGKVRHLDTQVMWIQQRIRNNDFDLYKILGDENPADISTKAFITRERMEHMVRKLGCTFEDGRPISAPQLRQEGGKKIFATMPGRGGRGGSTSKRCPTSFSKNAGGERTRGRPRWADEEDDELTPSDHEKTSGSRVVPPPPPNEVAEAEDSLCEHGLRLGSADNGRSPIGRPAEGARRSAQHMPSQLCVSLCGS